MIGTLSVTVLVDNQSDDPRLLCEHGLSLWIEADDRRILFDTGQTDLVARNADALRIDLRDADTLVLSHGHYDHTGGIVTLLGLNPSLAIYCHPGIFIPRYSRQPDGSVKPVGMPRASGDALHNRAATINWVSRPINLTGDIGVTGPIPRFTTFENTGGFFGLDPAMKEPDLISDDCAMWFITAGGVTVVTGCCHSGLVNTLTHIRPLAGALPLTTVIGGLHLLHASSERLLATCDYLQSTGAGRIVPCHCTGERAVACMQRQFGGSVVEPGGVGKREIIGVLPEDTSRRGPH